MRINRPALAAGLLVAGLFGTALSVRGDGPDRSDVRPTGRGNRVRGLSAKHDAGTGTTSTNGIDYHGGPVMHTANVYYILYGNWAGLDPTGQGILENWARVMAPSPYFNINTTYTDTTGAVPNAVTFMGTNVDTGSLGTSLSDTQIAQLVSNAINAGFPGSPNTPGVADPNGLYMVLTAPGVAETSGFLTQYCGWHWSGAFSNHAVQAGLLGSTNVKFAFIGNAAGPSFGACAVQSTSPNGDAGADAMISVMTHELSEAVSDPLGNAWYDASGEENGDKCAWNFGSVYAAPNGSAANVNLSGNNYLIQQMWVNANGGGCVLSYVSSPDFSVSVSGSQTILPGGTSGNYTLTAIPSNGFTGPVTWTITPPAGITASTPAVSNTATFTLTASASLAPGTYTIPVTGTFGSLQHSTSATLVVSAPSYSLSISPSSQSVSRPSSGTVTATYTVTVNPSNGFNQPVTISVSGGSTGVALSLSGTNPVAPGGTIKVIATVSSNAKRNSSLTITVHGTASGQTQKSATAKLQVH